MNTPMIPSHKRNLFREERQGYRTLVLMGAMGLIYLMCFLAGPRLTAQVSQSSRSFRAVQNQRQTLKDSRGFKWDVHLERGMIRRGSNQAFSGAAMLEVNGNQFKSQSQKTSGGNSFLLSGQVAGIQVERRIKLDRDKAGLRFTETFRNETNSDKQIKVKIDSELGRRKSRVQTNTGRTGLPLKQKETGVVIHQKHAPSIMFLVRGGHPRERKDVSSDIHIQGRDEVKIRYQLTVPSNDMASITYTIAQRKTKHLQQKQDIEKEFQPFLSSNWLEDVPSDVRKTILNIPSSLWMLGEAGADWMNHLKKLQLEPSSQDQLVLEENMKLKGDISSGSVEVDTRFGKKTFPVDRISAVTGALYNQEHQLLFLQDGRILKGSITFQDTTFRMGAGPAIPLTSSRLDRFARHDTSIDKHALSDVAGYVELVSGERFALADGDLRIPIMTPWGTMDLPKDRLLLVTRANDVSSGNQIILKNGTRLHGFLKPNQVDVDLTSFGDQTIQLSRLVQFVSRDIVSGEMSKGEVKRHVESSTRAVLAGQNVFVGDIDSNSLAIVNRSGRFDLKSRQIRKLTQLDHTPDNQPRFRITLWEGGTISGRLDRKMVRLRSSDLTLTVPTRHLKHIQRPKRNVPSRLKKEVARKIRKLGHPSWEVREDATERLKEIGALAVPQLEDAKNERKDPEIQRRVKKILKEVQQ